MKEGDSVGKGKLLVKIRPDTWVSQFNRAEASLNQQKANSEASKASLARATATYERAKLEHDRQKKLYDQNVISASDWQLQIRILK